MKQITIVFCHQAIGQFSELFHYFNGKPGYRVMFMGGDKASMAVLRPIPNIQPFPPAVREYPLEHAPRAMHALRRAEQVKKGIEQLDDEIKVDIVVGHAVFGSPHLIDRPHIKRVVYAEFPNYKAHGWHPDYPPTQDEMVADDIFGVFVNEAARQADVTVVPSQYAKSLFPKSLQRKITVLPDGHVFTAPLKVRKDTGKRVGFFARDLSTAKGFDRFIDIAKVLCKRDPEIEFLVVGGALTPYSYERNAIAKLGKKTFAAHLLQQARVPLDRFTFTGLLANEAYLEAIDGVSVVLYPLRFGSANWGLFKCLSRGKAIIASDRCFLPEVIEDGKTGVLLPLEDTEAWAQKTLSLLNDQKLRECLAVGAEAASKHYTMAVVGPAFEVMLQTALTASHQPVGAHL